jgi:hypothetical protein
VKRIKYCKRAIAIGNRSGEHVLHRAGRKEKNLQIVKSYAYNYLLKQKRLKPVTTVRGLFFYFNSELGRYENFLINCGMDFHRELLAYFYAIALSLWTAVIPLSTAPLSMADAREITSEKVSSFDGSNSVFLVNQNSLYQSISFRVDGASPNIHFFNEGNFQFVFLKNIFATAFSILRARDINFEFIDLIYPFHYFW